MNSNKRHILHVLKIALESVVVVVGAFVFVELLLHVARKEGHPYLRACSEERVRRGLGAEDEDEIIT